VLAGTKAIVIGIECDDPNPAGIVSFSKQRDAVLASEDHVRVVIGPYLDGRSGYVFAVNPSGARYDALIEPGGESDNPNWDGIWEAATRHTARGWAVEIRIPIETLAFNRSAREWEFNVERRIQRLLEVDRWAGAERQYRVTQPSRAGRLTDLPSFALGVGLTLRPAMTAGGGVPGPGERVSSTSRPSFDLTQRVGANVLASATVNTDFAETDVDTRRTNLTRFPLFFPEKRTFFLEGADIFSFGLGLDEDVIPYFSRRIGLVDGTEVPITAGGKINGRSGDTNFGGLVVGTNDRAEVVDDETAMAVGRVKQNLWGESWVGGIATVGDPLGRSGSWMGGVDFTYATSRFRGNKNFLVGVWALAMDREDAGTDRMRARIQDRLSERPLGHLVQVQAHRPRLRSLDRLRAAPRRTSMGLRRRQSDADCARSGAAAHARISNASRDRSRRTMGELRSVHGAGELALSDGRSRRVQRGAGGRAVDRAV
jgi:hypothetical protein